MTASVSYSKLQAVVSASANRIGAFSRSPEETARGPAIVTARKPEKCGLDGQIDIMFRR